MMQGKITARRAAGLFLMPGIVPRLRELFGTGFTFIAVTLAQIYRAARLLPPGHPYLMPANAGRFSVRQVVVEASRNLTYKRENIDQIAIFYVILIGLAILVIQFALLVGAFFGHSAHAATMPTSFDGFFQTPVPDTTYGSPGNDIAFVLLDRVFGIPGLFLDSGGNATCVENNQPCFSDFNPNSTAEGAYPWPFHLALQAMLQFYSIGLLVIGVMIMVYYILAVAAETAQTGTPFGKRFNNVWAPIRIVVAFGLLIPVSNGLNSAQYILLYAAKWGSGFATNGWNMFTNNLIGSTLAGDQQALIAAPNVPDLTKMLEFFSAAETCRAFYETVVNPSDGSPSTAGIVRAYLVDKSNATTPREEITSDFTYDQALSFYHNQDIRIVFGTCVNTDSSGADDCDNKSSGKPVYAQQPGYVLPVCGQMTLPVSGAINPATNPGTYSVQEAYFNLIRDTWLGGADNDDDPSNDSDRVCDDTQTPDSGNMETIMRHWGYCWVDAQQNTDAGVVPPDDGDYHNLINGAADANADPTEGYDYLVQQIIDTGVVNERSADEWAFEFQDLGWAGAGVWYNKIAQMNGAMISAVANVPRIDKYPMSSEAAADQRQKNDKIVSPLEVFVPVTSNGAAQVTTPDIGDKAATLSTILGKVYTSWNPIFVGEQKKNGDTLDDIIDAVFGRINIFTLNKQCGSDPGCVSNANVAPIALLAGLGDSLINATVVCFGLGGLGTLASIFDGVPGGAMISTIGTAASTIGLALLSVGFILYYVVPFMPFLYFFFAVGGWIKGIFEAMVGVPLWALAHIRIDGEGLAGSAAMGGYFMIFEIFLRPILIVFAMLASILIFSAQVFVLNDIWSLVTTNLTGFDYSNNVTDGGTGSLAMMRDKLDQLFFTIIYAFVVYMLGTSSFKLITFLPSGIMRWMGSGVRAFSDQEEDPGKGLVGRISQGSAIGTNLASQGLQGATKGAKGLGQALNLTGKKG